MSALINQGGPSSLFWMMPNIFSALPLRAANSIRHFSLKHFNLAREKQCDRVLPHSGIPAFRLRSRKCFGTLPLVVPPGPSLSARLVTELAVERTQNLQALVGERLKRVTPERPCVQIRFLPATA
jgi:hypothetical protein